MTLHELKEVYNVNAQGDLNLFAHEDNPRGIERTIDLTQLKSADLARYEGDVDPDNIRVTAPWRPEGRCGDWRSVGFWFDPERATGWIEGSSLAGTPVRVMHRIEFVDVVMNAKTGEMEFCKVNWTYSDEDDRIILPYWMKARAKKAVMKRVDTRGAPDA